MTVTFAPGTDFVDVIDGLEAVTLNRRGSSSDVEITSALQRNVSTAEIGPSDGRYRAGDVRWHLPVSEVSATPQLGDWIVDAASARWQVIEVGEDTLSSRWRCVTRNLAIAYGLNDTVVIEEAVYAKATGGAAKVTYHVWKSGVRARIQEVATTIGTELETQRTAKQFHIFLESDYEINHNHRIRDRKGDYYKIEGTANKAELGQAQVVEASEWR
jgi:hypothetical protein